jgi:hypothetical protein
MDRRLFDLHLGVDEIRAGIDRVLASPGTAGTIELIVRRPKVGKREVLASGALDVSRGLIGDNWLTRGSSRTPDNSAHPEMQLNLMNYRFAELIAGCRERVPLAGDQLFVDFDLSAGNIPPGTRLSVGEAIIEVTAVPHTGCKKFVERFGVEAMKFANSDFGRRHNFRGINAKVIRGGAVAVGDIIERVSDQS